MTDLDLCCENGCILVYFLSMDCAVDVQYSLEVWKTSTKIRTREKSSYLHEKGKFVSG